MLQPVQPLNSQEVHQVIQAALKEDVGLGDVTTLALIPANATAKAVLRARQPLVLAGVELAEETFRELSPEAKSKRAAEDGKPLAAGDTILTVSGPARALLTAERVALNFVQRLSGIATFTAQFVDAVRGTRAQILDTRKTTPGWRRLEKYAVTCGGGHNHRMGLFDMVLIKDNHLAVLKGAKPNPIAAALEQTRSRLPGLKLEVEVDTLEQLEQALAAGAHIVLLDNMDPAQMRVAVEKCQGRAQTEASGGVSLAGIRAVAETGVDFISVGALTHSAPAVDIGLDFTH